MINNHIKSNKHNTGKEIEEKQSSDMEIIEALKSYDTAENPKGTSLPVQ